MSAQYVPLSTMYNEEPHVQIVPRRGYPSVLLLACIGAICSSTVALLLFVGKTESGANEPFPRAQDELGTMPHLLPYPNLDRLYANTARNFPPIINFPDVVQQIHVHDPARKTVEDDSHKQITDVGEIYPDDRHVVINAQTSTVVHFRVKDYAMNRCSLVVRLSQPSSRLNSELQIHDPSDIGIWILDSSNQATGLLRGSLNRAPARRAYLTGFRVRVDENSTHEDFPCRSGDYMALEFACSPESTSCSIDFWQHKRVHAGIFLIQYSGVGGNLSTP